MKLTQHPEYQRVYVHNQEAFQRCQAAIATWQTHNNTIVVPDYALHWTYETARSFVRSLSLLFQEYNRVLWQGFHYCRECGGQCCVVDASHVRAFDLLAIALLDVSAPVLSDNLTRFGRECIYLSNHQCSWPAEWRTIKCWSFYCLGVGPWQPGASIGEMRGAIIAELRQVVHDYLPAELRKYEIMRGIALADYLDDPVHFAETLQDALCAIFVDPFNEHYPVITTLEAGEQDHNNAHKQATTSSLLLNDALATFIAEAVEQVCEYPPTVPEELDITLEQLLEDLESLQWISEGQPSHAPKLLAAMYLRYANAPAPAANEQPTIWHRMRDHLYKVASKYP